MIHSSTHRPQLRYRAVHRAAVAEVGPGGEQSHVRVALDRGLRRPVGGAVVGHQHADRPLGRMRQRCQEPVQMRARRIGHRDHRQDVTHALRVTVEGCAAAPGAAPALPPARLATAAAATGRPAATADRTAPNTAAGAPAAGCRSLLTGRTRSGSAPTPSNTARACPNRVTSPAVGGMHDSGRRLHAPVDHLEQRADQVGDIGRRADLVVHHLDDPVAGGQFAHGGDEVFTVSAGVDPGGADHHGLRQRRQHRLFAGQLGLPVHTQRPGLVVQLIGMRRRVAEVAAEHIVGGDVHQPRAGPRAGLRDVLRAGRIDRVCPGLVVFGVVDVGVGRAVDHHVAGLHDLRRPAADR